MSGSKPHLRTIHIIHLQVKNERYSDEQELLYPSSSNKDTMTISHQDM